VDAQQLFLATLDDLSARLQDPEDEYKMLRAAGLVRQLLLDKHPLMHKVKKDHRVKIRFRVTQHPARMGLFVDDRGVAHALPEGSMWFILDGLDPARFPEYPVEELDLSHFLSVPTMKVRSGEVTVRDVIRHAAHAESGVHHGAAESPRIAAACGLLRVDIDGKQRSAAAVAMKGIISVVLAAMEPLKVAVAHGSSGGSSSVE
jgi:hypothetical protein